MWAFSVHNESSSEGKCFLSSLVMVMKVESSEHIKDIKCLYIKDKTCELDVMQEKRSRLTSMFYLKSGKDKPFPQEETQQRRV